MKKKQITIDGNSLHLSDVWKAANGELCAVLTAAAKTRVDKCRKVVEEAIREKKVIYGVNTGFGKFSTVHISDDKIEQLQENLVLSHAAGVGAPFSPEVVRAVLLLKANTLSKGFSGIRREPIQLLLDFLQQDVLPVIPEQGSVGASGDLAPLAHLVLPMLGRGYALVDGQRLAGTAVLEKLGRPPVILKAKEGLALLNGTQVTTSLAVIAWYRLQHLVRMADIVGAMSLEALKGTPTAFDSRIHQARGLRGQITSAHRLQMLLKDSPIVHSHLHCEKVQDAYSLRCMPQVHGAVWEAVNFGKGILEIEINAATDNPLIFTEDNAVLSGGNFHAQPISLVGDVLGIAAAQLAGISERRIEYLCDPNTSSMAGFLTEEGGLNSGFMIAQVTAASLVSENKTLAHPASVDSVPTSANKEDYVSMGTWAARKALQIVSNAEKVLAIELLCAVQGMDFKFPLKSSRPLQYVHDVVREKVAHWGQDREMAPEIENAWGFIRDEALLSRVEQLAELRNSD